MSKMAKVATGVEWVGAAFLLVVFVPLVYSWILTSREADVDREEERIEQRVLIQELEGKVNALTKETP